MSTSAFIGKVHWAGLHQNQAIAVPNLLHGFSSAGKPAAIGLHQVASLANTVNFQTAEHSAATLVNSQDDTNAKASQQAPAKRAQSDAQDAFASAPSQRPPLPKDQDLPSGQLASKTDSQPAAKPQRQLGQSPLEAAAGQSSVHAGSDQLAQYSRAMSEHRSPEKVTRPNSGGISTGISGPRGIANASIAADLHHETPALVCSGPNDAGQSSSIASQRAAAGSLTEQPDVVTRSADFPLVHSSSSNACQRLEACGSGTRPEAPAASVVGMADHSSRHDPQSCKGGPHDMVGNSKDPQGSKGCPSNVAGKSSRKDPQSKTGGPQQGLKAAHSSSAVRPSSERHSASSSPAEDAPECSPADDEPVFMENQVIVPLGKRLSQASGKVGISLDVNGSDFSKSQDPASVEHTKVSHPAEQAAVNADLHDKAMMASGVEAANKENDVSPALLAASDSQVGAQAVMEEEQAQAAAAAAAQVALSCLSLCRL